VEALARVAWERVADHLVHLGVAFLLAAPLGW
jgi:hypothetical protein